MTPKAFNNDIFLRIFLQNKKPKIFRFFIKKSLDKPNTIRYIIDIKETTTEELKMIKRYKVVDQNGCYYKIFDNVENKAFQIKGKEKLINFFNQHKNECY